MVFIAIFHGKIIYKSSIIHKHLQIIYKAPINLLQIIYKSSTNHIQIIYKSSKHVWFINHHGWFSIATTHLPSSTPASTSVRRAWLPPPAAPTFPVAPGVARSPGYRWCWCSWPRSLQTPFLKVIFGKRHDLKWFKHVVQNKHRTDIYWYAGSMMMIWSENWCL